MDQKNFLTKLLEAVIMFALAMYLLRVAVQWFLEVWPVLAIIAGIILLCIIAYRVYRHFRDVGKW